MPRQLPWLDNASSSRGQKLKPKQKTKDTGIDDDFFDGTVLASSKKGIEIARTRGDSSDDELPTLPREVSTPPTKRTKGGNDCVASSSPPQVQHAAQPRVEYMRTGSKYDLRDDEWMMVEDEFLETAKLFTRHLHIAEYKKLKEQIESKKKEQIQAVRPVVKGITMSAEGRMKERAKTQERKQRTAIRDVFASYTDYNNEDDNDEEDIAIPAVKGRLTCESIAKTRTAPQSRPSIVGDSDSDDLEILGEPRRCTSSSDKTASTVSPSTSRKNSTPAKPDNSSTFAKPSLHGTVPKLRTVASRSNRATPFDMLDDYIPPSKRIKPTFTSPIHDAPKVQFAASSPGRNSPTKQTAVSDEVRRGLSVKLDDLDDWASSGRRNTRISKGTVEHLAKRKAEKQKGEEKQTAVKLDDIPTFLF